MRYRCGFCGERHDGPACTGCGTTLGQWGNPEEVRSRVLQANQIVDQIRAARANGYQAQQAQSQNALAALGQPPGHPGLEQWPNPNVGNWASIVAQSAIYPLIHTEAESRIEALQADVAQAYRECSCALTMCDERNDEIARLNDELKAKDAELSDLRQRVAERDAAVTHAIRRGR